MAAPKDPNTVPARAARGRQKAAQNAHAAASAPGTLGDVRTKLWACIERVEKLMTDGEPEAALVLKSAHALVQACGAYVKTVEAAELEARLNELEARLGASSSGDGAASRPPLLIR